MKIEGKSLAFTQMIFFFFIFGPCACIFHLVIIRFFFGRKVSDISTSYVFELIDRVIFEYPWFTPLHKTFIWWSRCWFFILPLIFMVLYVILDTCKTMLMFETWVWDLVIEIVQKWCYRGQYWLVKNNIWNK